MNNLLPTAESFNLVATTAQSELFTRYRQAFRQATGRLPRFTSPSQNNLDLENFWASPRLRIPVMLDNRLLGVLSLDPYKVYDDKNNGFDELASQMLDAGATPAQLRAARKAYDGLPAVTSEFEQAMKTMLQIFSEQLGEYAEKFYLHANGSEPATIGKARTYILSHLGDPVTLETVASHAGVSVCYFCKLFKKATGLTFTEFLTRARVEEAKRHLLSPQIRIIEVAYAVGFQSLSQFNRSFKRLTTLSPTEFRSSRNRLLARSAA